MSGPYLKNLMSNEDVRSDDQIKDWPEVLVSRFVAASRPLVVVRTWGVG